MEKGVMWMDGKPFKLSLFALTFPLIFIAYPINTIRHVIGYK